ncbi:hypothetical protein HFO56_24035 [Rhizobium laguerreae]|uniref:hypothetical protein n=1 Tax=Rhizobium laguerreae TaxID=1076926 RepID=UPI001C90BB5A|nr:hypothetical protein [Rhizobium laguerreae]MBY3155399.1 hypothetical protein [Rhizobium laguerreae]
MPQVKEQIGFIDFSAEETARPEVLAPDDVIKQSLKVLAAAIDALKSSREPSSKSRGGHRRSQAVSARPHIRS